MSILSQENYMCLIGRMPCEKIPGPIMSKIENGEDFTEDEEKTIEKIVNEHRSQC